MKRVTDLLESYLQKTGCPIGRLVCIDPYNDHPHLHHYAAEYSSYGKNAKDALMEPNALDEDELAAKQRCIFEAIERHYLVDSPLQRSITRAQTHSEISVNHRAISPTVFAVPHYKSSYDRFVDDFKGCRYRWIRASDHVAKSAVYIPSQLALWPKKEKEEKLLRDIDTTGTAAGCCYAQAWVNATLELCERESFAILYYTHAAGHRISLIRGHPSYNLSLLIGRYGFDVLLIEMLTDLPIHTVSCWLINKSDIGPYLTVGVSAHFSQSVAVHKSILEALQSQTNARNMQAIDRVFDKATSSKTAYSRPYMRRATVRNMLLWSNKQQEMHDFVAFLKQIKTVRAEEIDNDAFCDQDVNMSLLIRSLRLRGISRIYGINLAPDLKTDGLYVVRAIIPELTPLSLKQRYNYVETSRIFSVPKKLRARYIGDQRLFSTIPHPFP